MKTSPLASRPAASCATRRPVELGARAKPPMDQVRTSPLLSWFEARPESNAIVARSLAPRWPLGRSASSSPLSHYSTTTRQGRMAPRATKRASTGSGRLIAALRVLATFAAAEPEARHRVGGPRIQFRGWQILRSLGRQTNEKRPGPSAQFARPEEKLAKICDVDYSSCGRQLSFEPGRASEMRN